MILDHEPEGVKNNGVTVKGFLFIFCKQKQKIANIKKKKIIFF